MSTTAVPDTHPPRPQGWLSRNKIAVAPWVFLAPALLFFSVYVVWPIFESIWLSFYEWNGLYAADGSSTATWVGFGNYVKLWDDPNFWMSLKNNVLWLVLYMLAVPAGLFIALFFNPTVTGSDRSGRRSSARKPRIFWVT